MNSPIKEGSIEGVEADVGSALRWLKAKSTQSALDGMARYAIPSKHALGVAMKDIKGLGKQLGCSQELAAALWNTGVYEARMLASFVGDPKRITSAQMDRWCKEFDNWAFCDAMCFNLFDRTPHAWAKVRQWSGSEAEFVKRTAFATRTRAVPSLVARGTITSAYVQEVVRTFCVRRRRDTRSRAAGQ